MPRELPESDCFVSFAERRRRLALRILREYPTPLTMIELADHIERREYENPSAERLRAIYLDLYHDHLPRLEEADAVVYDRDEGTVHPGANFDLLVRALEEENERVIVSPEGTPQEGHATPRWIELFVRSSTPAVVGERVDAVLDRLKQLRDEGFITGYRLRQWPPRGSARVTSRASASSFATRQEIVAEFDAWAEEHGYTLQPAFGRRLEATLGSEGDAGEYYTVPLLTLAFYEGETLTGVIPCADSQHTYTVADFLSSRTPEDLVVLTD